MRFCPACGSGNEDDSSTCRSCGAALPASVPVGADERKVVTVLFSDVTGSTAMGEQLDPESLRSVMARYFAAMRSVLERHGATIEKYIGDAVMAVFGLPRSHEDDALRAVRAAGEMRIALQELNRELDDTWGVTISTRTGLNTGEVITGDADRRQSLVVGDAVNVAARFEQAAGPGEILIGSDTLRLVRDAVVAEPVGPLTLKGKAEPVSAWRVLEVRPSTTGWDRRLDSPLVARDHELARLRAVFERAVATSTCQVASIVGSAGIGKSRLTNELLVEVVGDARVAQGRCLPYGEGITFWPVAEILRGLAGIGDLDDRDEARAKVGAVVQPQGDGAAVCDRVAGLLGIGDETPSIQETFWAVRRLLQELAKERPLIVLFDDLHWAEPTLLDLLEYLVGWLGDIPVMLICMGRPELLEIRPGWLATQPNTTLVTLEPLSHSGIEALVHNLLDGVQVDEGSTMRISQLAEGNPLFVEETLRMLIDDGLLKFDNGGWTATRDLSHITIPPTIHALLTARLDRLAPEERATIQRASVIGREFWWGALAELTPADLHSQVGHQLQSLSRKELIRPGQSQLIGEDVFEFAHILVQEAAYGGMPKETRAELHERLADWVERKSQEWVGEYEEILGYHLERANRARLELGPPTAHTRAQVSRAATLLASAGRRAFSRGDMPAAVNLLSRATTLSDAEDPQRLDLLPRLAFALMETGDFERLMEVVVEARQAATMSGDPSLLSHATILELYVRLFTSPESWVEEAELEARSAIAEFERLGDHGGLAKGWSLLGLVNVTKGRFAPAQEAWERAAAHAERAGERRDQLEALSWALLSTWAGPTPLAEGLHRCHAVLEAAGTDHKARATAMFMRALLEVGLGNIREARRLIGQARALLEEVAMTTWMAGPMTQVVGLVELTAGDPATAERALRWGDETLQTIGEVGWRPTLVALLAEAVYEQGRHDEAGVLAKACQDMAGSDDVWSQVLWRTVTGKVLARRGQADEGERLAREAVDLAASTDSLPIQGEVLLGLAEVLELTGRAQEASHTARQAVAVFERKGDTQAARSRTGHLNLTA